MPVKYINYLIRHPQTIRHWSAKLIPNFHIKLVEEQDFHVYVLNN